MKKLRFFIIGFRFRAASLFFVLPIIISVGSPTHQELSEMLSWAFIPDLKLFFNLTESSFVNSPWFFVVTFSAFILWTVCCGIAYCWMKKMLISQRATKREIS